jgi:hypothetical protein
MTKRLLILAIALAIPLAAGCNPATKLHGKWDMETEETQPPAMGGAYIPSVVAGFMKPKMHLEFLQNGTCKAEARMAGESESGRGKWRYVKTEGDVMVLMVQMDGGEEHELRVRFLERNKIETVPLPVGDDEDWTEQTLVFTRRPF